MVYVDFSTLTIISALSKVIFVPDGGWSISSGAGCKFFPAQGGQFGPALSGQFNPARADFFERFFHPAGSLSICRASGIFYLVQLGSSARRRMQCVATWTTIVKFRLRGSFQILKTLRFP
jgi:hypothetical protein